MTANDDRNGETWQRDAFLRKHLEGHTFEEALSNALDEALNQLRAYREGLEYIVDYFHGESGRYAQDVLDRAKQERKVI